MEKSKRNTLGNMNLGRFKGHSNKPSEEELNFTRSWEDPKNPEEIITFTRKAKVKHVKTEGVAYRVPRKDLRIRPIHDEAYYIFLKKTEEETEALKESIRKMPKYSEATIDRIMETLNVSLDTAWDLLHLHKYTNKIPGYIEGLQKLKTKKSVKINNVSHGRFTKKEAEPIKRQGVKRVTKVLSTK